MNQQLQPRLFRAAAALLALALGSASGDQQGGKKVRQVRFVQGLQYGTRDFPEIPVHMAGAQESLAKAFATIASYYRPFANDEMNSRLGARLPLGNWAVRWSADLNPQLTPTFVLEAGDRILLRADMWFLFDRDGAKIAEGQAAGPSTVMDTANKLFYHVLPTGYFAASRLSDGKQEFLFLTAFTDSFTRIFLGRRASRLMAAAVETSTDPHGRKKPSKSLVEILDVGDPVKIGANGRVAGSKAVGELDFPSPQLAVAAHADRIVAASRDAVYLTDWDLTGRGVITGNFVPQSLSLDETGRIYLVVQEDGKTRLWSLTDSGERIYSYEFPRGAAVGAMPPVIGYDHTAYVFGGNYIYAVGSDGKLEWSREASGKIAGAIVTGDDQLVVSEGTKIVAWNREGNWRLLHALKEDLLTPPVLTATNTLLVATRRTLYCLALER